MSSIKNLKVVYDDQFTLDVPALEIPDQGITLLQGPSGSGKTSFLRCLMGLEKSHFEWNMHGQDLAKLAPPDRRLGVVFQSVDLFPHLTVQQNILFHAQARKIPADKYESKLHKWLQVSGLGSKLNQKANTLSGGEKQRVALLRALIGEPRILLLDEPFSALDPALKVELKKLITEIVKIEQVPCLVVSHDENDAANFAKYVIIFENGKIIPRRKHD